MTGIDCLLFVNDTAVLGVKGEMSESVIRVKIGDGHVGRKNDEENEEVLQFGTEKGDEVRNIRSWLGEKKDMTIRIRRAGKL